MYRKFTYKEIALLAQTGNTPSFKNTPVIKITNNTFCFEPS